MRIEKILCFVLLILLAGVIITGLSRTIYADSYTHTWDQTGYGVRHVFIIDIDGLKESVLYDAISSKKLTNVDKIIFNELGSKKIKFDHTINTFPSYTFVSQASIFTGRWSGGNKGHGIIV